MKIYKFPYNSKYNSASPSPPMVPQVTYLKSMESQLSLEKKINIVAFLDHSLQYFKTMYQNDPKYVHSGVQTHKSYNPKQKSTFRRFTFKMVKYTCEDFNKNLKKQK